MESKRTKGEWKISRSEHDNIIHIFARRPNERQTIVTIETPTETESLANARLIASAPDLLEALILANKLITRYVPELSEQHLKIKDAIEKATK